MQRNQLYRFIVHSGATKNVGGVLKQLPLPIGDLIGVQLKLFAQFSHRLILTQCGKGEPCLERGRVGATGTSR